MDRSKYPSDWRAISKRIRERDGQRCKFCKVPNGEVIERGIKADAGRYRLPSNGQVFDEKGGKYLGASRPDEFHSLRLTRVVLTVAHLDQDTANNADENLAALCQKCHLAHDKAQHAANARKTRRSRKAVGNLPGID